MSKLLRYIIVLVLTGALALGSFAASAGVYDQYKLTFSTPRWHTIYNNFLDAVGAQVSALGAVVANWVGTVDSLTLIETTPTFSDDHTCTLTGDFTAVLTPGKRLVADCGADGLRPNTVASCTYAAPNSTVVVNTANLTANLAAVSYYATRNGVNTYGSGDIVASEYGAPSWAHLQSAVALANASGRRLLVTPGTWPVSDNLTSTAPVYPVPGAILEVATTKTLTLSGGMEAGLYPIISCVGTGKVSGLKTGYPEWFGAVGDGSTDDTAALTAAEAALVPGGRFIATGIYKTSGLLITKTLTLSSDSPIQFGAAVGGVFKAAGAQAYVVKVAGTYAADASTFLQPYLRNLNIDADNQAISDAALVMEYTNFAYLDRPSIQNANGHGIRMRGCWEPRVIDPWISNCGTINGGSAFFIDGPAPFNAAHGTNNLRIVGGTWGANRGRWIDVSSLANLDAAWIEGNKLELDNATTPNTAPTDVIHIGAASRLQVTNNDFAGFGLTSDNYANLIYLNGDPANTSYGGPSNRIFGNRAVAYNPTSGAINGLYLDTNAPTCEEGDNTFVGYNGETCPNVNVSQYSQLISLTWRNQSGSLYPMELLPNRELAGFLSIHKVSQGAFAIPFMADANVINNAQTALQLAAADQTHAQICNLYDLSRFVGCSTKHVVVRVRMRLDAAGSVTVYANPSYPVWAGVPVVVDSTDWAWHEFVFPSSAITATNHLLTIFHWAINIGAPNLLVDGMEFDTTNVIITTVTTGSPTLAVTGILPRITYLNSAGGAITATLPDGAYIGQRQIIIMTDATNSSTLSVTHHTTSDPEIFTFAVLGAYLELEWDGTDWVTIANHGATT